MDIDGAGARMKAWEVPPGGASTLLREVERAVPVPAADEVLVRVRVCGVCRTDLHLAEGDLPPKAPGVVPGHEVVGEVVARGPAVTGLAVGDRVGIAWLRRTCLQCRWCRSGAENLCRRSEYTGWDADGGFAEYAVAPAAYVYALPEGFTDLEAAPLLCAGIIGYRALRRAQLPPGGRLGIYGFGASAHITAQIALAQGAEVHVLTRGEGARALALELGATSAGRAHDRPPVLLDAAIVFAPAGDLVPLALEGLDQNGTLALAGIHLTDIPTLVYERHLFRERTLTSVTANTRADGAELLRLASALAIAPRVTAYPFDDTDRALEDLRAGAVTGAAVVEVA
jgi:propanol-preferring alcohol dehydrogenase